MPTPHRTTKSQAAEMIQPAGRKPRIRPPPPPHSEPAARTGVAAGKRPSSAPGNDEPRRKVPKASNATTGAAQNSRESYQLPRAGLPPSNAPSKPPIPAVKVTSFSLRGGPTDNHSFPPSTASSNSSISSPSPSQSSELGSVASFTGRVGPRSALHSGSLELASVLEAVKRLLERHCYRVSPFIAPGEEMMDVSTE
jgi:hypothetical protein